MSSSLLLLLLLLLLLPLLAWPPNMCHSTQQLLLLLLLLLFTSSNVSCTLHLSPIPTTQVDANADEERLALLVEDVTARATVAGETGPEVR